jgi:hypothetical protein
LFVTGLGPDCDRAPVYKFLICEKKKKKALQIPSKSSQVSWETRIRPGFQRSCPPFSGVNHVAMPTPKRSAVGGVAVQVATTSRFNIAQSLRWRERICNCIKTSSEEQKKQTKTSLLVLLPRPCTVGTSSSSLGMSPTTSSCSLIMDQTCSLCSPTPSASSGGAVRGSDHRMSGRRAFGQLSKTCLLCSLFSEGTCLPLGLSDGRVRGIIPCRVGKAFRT